jgi:hypothetical protein
MEGRLQLACDAVVLVLCAQFYLLLLVRYLSLFAFTSADTTDNNTQQDEKKYEVESNVENNRITHLRSPL